MPYLSILVFLAFSFNLVFAGEASGPPAVDGWCAADVSIELNQPTGIAVLAIRGSIPSIDGATIHPHLTAFLDGKKFLSTDLAIGNFELRSIATTSIGIHKIKLTFEHPFQLPPPDGRIVGAQLKQIAYEPIIAPGSRWSANDHMDGTDDIISVGDAVGLGSGWGPFEHFGADYFRWMPAHADLAVLPNCPIHLLLSAAPGPNVDPLPCVLVLRDNSGHPIDKIHISHRGVYDILLQPIALSDEPLHLDIENPTAPGKSDPRQLCLEVFGISSRLIPEVKGP